MVLRFYWIIIFCMIIGMFVIAIFESEQKRREHRAGKKYMNFINTTVEGLNFLGYNVLALFVIYNVFMVIYSIVEKHLFFMVIPILFLLFGLFCFINEHVEKMDFLTEGISVVFLFLWLVYTAFFSLFAIDRPIKEAEVAHKCDFVQTIDILEFKQVPYNSITGRRYYIKSSPDSAYYYEVRTEKGGTTTKVIDGANNYVEKFESDEYIDNPHIEVYKNYDVSYYITWYGNEVTKEENISYSYYIYMPSDSMFYEE